MKCTSINTGVDVINVCGWQGDSLETYLLPDHCIQGTFVVEWLLTNLGLKGRKISTIIKLNDKEATDKTVVKNGL